MTPKEKAKELIDKYFDLVEAQTSEQQENNARDAASITCDEVVEGLKQYLHEIYKEQDLSHIAYITQAMFVEHWRLIKQEINKL
jgi:LPS O-antigen subunit length determinant protein (WzzB/FepE family)